MHFRNADLDDVPRLKRLYKAVASAEPGSIARAADEVTDEYIAAFITRSHEGGLIIVLENEANPDELIAEIHAYKAGIKAFDHVLGELTILVDPRFQGRKLGRSIFTLFLDEIVNNRPDIGRVELFTGEKHRKALSLYESLGFVIDGRFEMRFLTPSGEYLADIAMSWHNPGFEFDGKIPRLG